MSRLSGVLAILLLTGSVARAGRTTLTDCAAVAKPRERAFCLLRSDDRGAVTPLLDIALALFKQDPTLGIGVAADFFYAAENAGVIAGKTDAAQLLTLAAAKQPATRTFAFRALGHMLSILRMGYANGADVDDQRLGTSKGPVAKACLAGLNAKQDFVAREAAICVGRTTDNAYAGALIELLAASQSTNVQAAALSGLQALEAVSEKKGLLAKLAPALARPLPAKWTSAEVALRGAICQFLAGYVDAGDTWAKAPAEKAASEIGNKQSQYREMCERLARKL